MHLKPRERNQLLEYTLSKDSLGNYILFEQVCYSFARWSDPSYSYPKIKHVYSPLRESSTNKLLIRMSEEQCCYLDAVITKLKAIPANARSYHAFALYYFKPQRRIEENFARSKASGNFLFIPALRCLRMRAAVFREKLRQEVSDMLLEEAFEELNDKLKIAQKACQKP